MKFLLKTFKKKGKKILPTNQIEISFNFIHPWIIIFTNDFIRIIIINPPSTIDSTPSLSSAKHESMKPRVQLGEAENVHASQCTMKMFAPRIRHWPCNDSFSRMESVVTGEGIGRMLASFVTVIRRISHSLMTKIRGDSAAAGAICPRRLNDNHCHKVSRFFTRVHTLHH